jgi:hypothetical protein
MKQKQIIIEIHFSVFEENQYCCQIALKIRNYI